MGSFSSYFPLLFFSFILRCRSIFHVFSLMMLVVPKTSLSVLNVLVYGCLHLSKMYRVFKAFESRQVKLIFNWISSQKTERIHANFRMSRDIHIQTHFWYSDAAQACVYKDRVVTSPPFVFNYNCYWCVNPIFGDHEWSKMSLVINIWYFHPLCSLFVFLSD